MKLNVNQYSWHELLGRDMKWCDSFNGVHKNAVQRDSKRCTGRRVSILTDLCEGHASLSTNWSWNLPFHPHFLSTHLGGVTDAASRTPWYFVDCAWVGNFVSYQAIQHLFPFLSPSRKSSLFFFMCFLIVPTFKNKYSDHWDLDFRCPQRLVG